MSLSDLLHPHVALSPIPPEKTVQQTLLDEHSFFRSHQQVILRKDLEGVDQAHQSDRAHLYGRYQLAELRRFAALREAGAFPPRPSLATALTVGSPVYEIVQHFHHVGREHQQQVYLIGGFVRDCTRNERSEDLDFVVVGSPSEYADHLVASSAQSSHMDIEILRKHPQFGTMTLQVTLRDGFQLKVDLATARTEFYTAPAELPTVHPAASIEEDIFRRDFTINTMGLQVSPSWDHFIDMNDALYDMIPHPSATSHGIWETEPTDLHEEKVASPVTTHRGFIRCLHPLSFVDDPTRIFRAIRFAVRFDYLIAYDTSLAILLSQQYQAIHALSGGRRMHEFQLICGITQTAAVFQAMLETPSFLGGNLVATLFPGFSTLSVEYMQNAKERVLQFPCASGNDWKVLLLVLGHDLSDKQFKSALAESFKPPDGTVKELLTCRQFATKFMSLRVEEIERFDVFVALERISEIAYQYLRANPQLSPPQQLALDQFAVDLKLKLQVDGNMLMELGIPKGKEIFVAKRALTRHCVNCPDITLRDSIEFQLDFVKTNLIKP